MPGTCSNITTGRAAESNDRPTSSTASSAARDIDLDAARLMPDSSASSVYTSTVSTRDHRARHRRRDCAPARSTRRVSRSGRTESSRVAPIAIRLQSTCGNLRREIICQGGSGLKGDVAAVWCDAHGLTQRLATVSPYIYIGRAPVKRACQHRADPNRLALSLPGRSVRESEQLRSPETSRRHPRRSIQKRHPRILLQHASWPRGLLRRPRGPLGHRRHRARPGAARCPRATNPQVSSQLPNISCTLGGRGAI
jgi:hypothetical protein